MTQVSEPNERPKNDDQSVQDDDQSEPFVSPSDANKDSSPAAPMKDNTVGTTPETRDETDTRDNQDREG